MTQVSLLVDKLQKYSNLDRAWKGLNKSNRSSHGLSSETIESFSRHFKTNRKVIRKELREGVYKFSGIRAKVIKEKKPSGQVKRRPIRISEVKDRVVQRAIVNVIEPILRKKYNLRNEASFAYLEERDIRKAILRMIKLYRKKNPVVLEADIKSYFDTVDRDKLLNEMIFPELPDDSINALITNALAQEVGNLHEVHADDWELFPDVGIPQGGGLSPLFANVYLHEFDREMLKEGYGLVRYADDFIVLCKDENEASDAYKKAVEILEGKLGLELHKLSDNESGKTRIVRLTQKRFEFLGVRYDGKHVYPAEKTLKNLHKKIRFITDYRGDKNILWVLQKLKYTVEGWIASYSFTKVEPYLPSIEKEISERLGVCGHRMGWLKNSQPLTARQRRFSGLPILEAYVSERRKNLKEEEKDLFGIS